MNILLNRPLVCDFFTTALDLSIRYIQQDPFLIW